MKKQSMRVNGGLYLVIDPSKGSANVLEKTRQAIDGGADIIQVWNRWAPGQDKLAFIRSVEALAHPYHIPVLIHEDYNLLAYTKLDGVHFDAIPPVDLDTIRQQAGRPCIIGITGGNDGQIVEWANRQGANYISFCALFPSPSAGACEIVRPETVNRARAMTTLPLFGSGGITTDNLHALKGIGLDGIAVISGIMNAPDPAAAARRYKELLKQLNNLQDDERPNREAGMSGGQA